MTTSSSANAPLSVLGFKIPSNSRLGELAVGRLRISEIQLLRAVLDEMHAMVKHLNFDEWLSGEVRFSDGGQEVQLVIHRNPDVNGTTPPSDDELKDRLSEKVDRLNAAVKALKTQRQPGSGASSPGDTTSCTAQDRTTLRALNSGATQGIIVRVGGQQIPLEPVDKSWLTEQASSPEERPMDTEIVAILPKRNLLVTEEGSVIRVADVTRYRVGRRYRGRVLPQGLYKADSFRELNTIADLFNQVTS